MQRKMMTIKMMDDAEKDDDDEEYDEYHKLLV